MSQRMTKAEKQAAAEFESQQRAEWEAAVADMKNRVRQALEDGDAVLADALTAYGRWKLKEYCGVQSSEVPGAPSMAWSMCAVTRAGVLAQEILRLREIEAEAREVVDRVRYHDERLGPHGESPGGLYVDDLEDLLDGIPEFPGGGRRP